MEPAHVHQAGRERDVGPAARMGPMAWTVESAVTAAMLTAVITPQGTVAAWLGGLVFTVTVCVLRAAGAPTARCPVTVRMGRPVPLKKAHVSVLLGTEAPLVKESAPLGTSDTAAVRPVHSASTVTGPATTSQDSATVCQASKVHSVMRCVPVDTLGRTVLGDAVAQTMEPVTPSMARASVTPDGSEVTALSPVLRVSGAPTASIHATVITEPSAALMTENANVRQDGPAFTALSAVH